MGTYTKNLKLETPSYTDNADIPALTKKNNEIIDSEMIKRANGLDYNEQTGVLQLTGNNSKVGSPIQIKNNLPVTSMSSGTELKVNNYKQLIKFTKEGKTEQKQYTGKNFWKLYNTQTSNGITLTQNDDGSILLNGTATEDTFFRIILDETINETTLSCDYKSGTISGAIVFIRTRASNGTINYSISLSSSSTTGIQLDRKTAENYYQEITVQKGTICSNVLLEVMLLKGNYNGDTLPLFEPYVGGQPSPNPDYPQEIENIKGVENLFYNVVTNSTPSGITITQNDDGSLILNGTTTGVSMFDFKLPKTLPAGTYTFNIEGSDNIPGNVFLRARDNNGQMVTSDAQVQGNNTTQNSHTFTCEKEIVKVSLNITTTGKTFNNFVIKPMLSKKKSNYVPFGSNYLQLENKTENLIGLDNKQYRVNLKKGDKIFAVNNGTTNLNLNLYTNYGDTARNDFFTIAANSQRLIVIANNSHAIAWGGTLDNNAWVVKGEKFIPYEPYQEKIINVDLKGNNLCSDRDKTIRDELVIENGSAKINKKIGKVVLTGDENWTHASSNGGFTLIGYFSNNSTPNGLCNYFKFNNTYLTWTKENYCGFNTSNVFWVKTSKFTTLAEFKAWLKAKYDAGNPVIIQYELSEPEVVDLGEVDFDLIENSTLTCEEESDMQIDYLTIDSNIFVQDSLDGNSSKKAPSVRAVNEIISQLEARIIALESKNV